MQPVESNQASSYVSGKVGRPPPWFQAWSAHDDAFGSSAEASVMENVLEYANIVLPWVSPGNRCLTACADCETTWRDRGSPRQSKDEDEDEDH